MITSSSLPLNVVRDIVYLLILVFLVSFVVSFAFFLYSAWSSLVNSKINDALQFLLLVVLLHSFLNWWRRRRRRQWLTTLFSSHHRSTSRFDLSRALEQRKLLVVEHSDLNIWRSSGAPVISLRRHLAGPAIHPSTWRRDLHRPPEAIKGQVTGDPGQGTQVSPWWRERDRDGRPSTRP